MRRSTRVLLAAAMVVTLGAPSAVSAANATGRNVQLPTGLSVSGMISDTHGNPVAGALAGLSSTPDSCCDASAISAADGIFAIHGLTGGTWYLKVFPPDGANLLAAWYDGSPDGTQDPAGAAPISVSGDVTGIDVGLPDGLRISGHVTNPGGDPVAGVTVAADGIGNFGFAVASDVDGLYQVVGMSPGDFTLTVYGPESGGYLGGIVVDGIVVADDGQPGTTYAVVGTDIVDADITILPGRSISGHVSGAGGLPVVVTAPDASISYPAPVDGSGNFTVTGLQPGEYRPLFAVPEDAQDMESQFPYGLYDGNGNVLVDQMSAGQTVDVTAGDASGIEAVLPVLPGISGTVRDALGPVANAMVLFGADGIGGGRVLSQGDGTFKILNVPNGAFTIQAGAAHHVVVGYADGRSNPDPAATAPMTVSGASVTGVNIVLPRGNAISGRITGTGGVPLAGIDVFAGPTSGGIWELGPGGTATDASGNFTVTGLVSGSYLLQFSPPLGSSYRAGYWSATGWTADWSAATPIAVSDATTPVVTAPVVALRVGGQLGASSVPLRIRWTATDTGSNIRANRLQQQTNAGSWVTVASPVTPTVDRSLTASTTTTYRLRSRATDFEGNTSADKTGVTFRLLRSQQNASSVTWKGVWSTALSASASGGSYRSTTRSSASATYRFTGKSIGWVATTGPTYGKARVYIDGSYVATVDCYAATTSWRRIVFAKAWSSSGPHTIRVVGSATAGRPRVTVDAFVVIR